MNDRFIESREAIMYAREALRNGAIKEAREWAERAAQLAPQSEDPWLILATIVSPRESIEYIRRALEANPNSLRAKKGMEWALSRLVVPTQTESRSATPPPARRDRQIEPGSAQRSKNPSRGPAGRNPRSRRFLFPILLILMGCSVFLFAAWSAMTSPVLASILSLSSIPVVQPTPQQSFAQVSIPKPTYTPQFSAQFDSFVPSMTVPATSIPPTTTTAPDSQGDLASDLSSVGYTSTPSPAPTGTLPLPTEPSGVALAEIIPDTPTSEYIAPTAAPYLPPQVANYDGEHWIDVDLSQQRVYAYAGDTLVNSFVVSTGTWQTPTVTGKYKVWIKLRSSDMSGPGYYLPDVPYVMYFYKGYGFHGTYWHNNFGTPMSHGCVNLTIPDAEWLYNFSVVGTTVNVHY